MPDVVSSNAESLRDTFAQYIKYNLRDVDELLVKKGRSLSITLYKTTPKATMADITAKLQELGWQVKRKYNANPRKGETTAQALQRMHNSIATARFNHAAYVASGWLPAVYRLQGSVYVLHPVSNPKGKVEISLGGDIQFISIANNTPGIEELEANKPFMDKAISIEVEDMLDYIQDHMRKNATIFNPSGSK